MREILVRSTIDLLLIIAALVMLTYEPRIRCWERKAARKVLRWAVKHIPAFRDWLNDEDADKPIAPHIIRDWRNNA